MESTSERSNQQWKWKAIDKVIISNHFCKSKPSKRDQDLVFGSTLRSSSVRIGQPIEPKLICSLCIVTKRGRQPDLEETTQLSTLSKTTDPDSDALIPTWVDLKRLEISNNLKKRLHNVHIEGGNYLTYGSEFILNAHIRSPRANVSKHNSKYTILISHLLINKKLQIPNNFRYQKTR